MKTDTILIVKLGLLLEYYRCRSRSIEGTWNIDVFLKADARLSYEYFIIQSEHCCLS